MFDPHSAPPFGTCPICSNTGFTSRNILWPELVAEWELAPDEVEYVNIQQGFACSGCGSNLRSMTLAAALMSGFANNDGTSFLEFCASSEISRSHSLLEINPAGSLTPFLQRFASYRLVEYPESDMQRMSEFADGSWDIVVHSDTLEHVPDPVRALAECRRVLSARGTLAYTVPIIVGRLTRRRDGLEPSYHGDPSRPTDDIRVVSEYGADAWCQAMEAGFRHVELFSLIYPHSVAILARK